MKNTLLSLLLIVIGEANAFEKLETAKAIFEVCELQANGLYDALEFKKDRVKDLCYELLMQWPSAADRFEKSKYSLGEANTLCLVMASVSVANAAKYPANKKKIEEKFGTTNVAIMLCRKEELEAIVKKYK